MGDETGAGKRLCKGKGTRICDRCQSRIHATHREGGIQLTPGRAQDRPTVNLGEDWKEKGRGKWDMDVRSSAGREQEKSSKDQIVRLGGRQKDVNTEKI